MEFGWWCISEKDYKFLKQFCKENKIRTVLEFWPWTSTSAFKEEWCSVVAYETEKELYEQYKKEIEWVDVRRLDICNPVIDWKYDLCFVDWPKWSVRLSRFVTSMLAIISSDIVMIHDSKREWERETIEKILSMWREEDFIDTEAWLSVLYRTK